MRFGPEGMTPPPEHKIERAEPTASERAVMHILKRMKADPRLAYLIGPGLQTFDLLMAAGADIYSYDVGPYTSTFTATLETRPVPGLRESAAVINDEHLHRMSLANDGVMDLDDLVNHFIGLGLKAYEARRDAHTEEMF